MGYFCSNELAAVASHGSTSDLRVYSYEPYHSQLDQVSTLLDIHASLSYTGFIVKFWAIWSPKITRYFCM